MKRIYERIISKLLHIVIGWYVRKTAKKCANWINEFALKYKEDCVPDEWASMKPEVGDIGGSIIVDKIIIDILRESDMKFMIYFDVSKRVYESMLMKAGFKKIEEEVTENICSDYYFIKCKDKNFKLVKGD